MKRVIPAARLWLAGSMLLWFSADAAEHREATARRPSERIYVAEVTRVFDGDTLWVQPEGGGRYRKLRLEGIDAPEICQPWGLASRDALARKVLGQKVQVEVRRYDTYGRALVKLRLGGADVAEQMVSSGHAWSYRWRSQQGPYAAEEDRARQQRRGLFEDAEPELPRQFRQRHGPCPQP